MDADTNDCCDLPNSDWTWCGLCSAHGQSYRGSSAKRNRACDRGKYDTTTTRKGTSRTTGSLGQRILHSMCHNHGWIDRCCGLPVRFDHHCWFLGPHSAKHRQHCTYSLSWTDTGCRHSLDINVLDYPRSSLGMDAALPQANQSRYVEEHRKGSHSLLCCDSLGFIERHGLWNR